MSDGGRQTNASLFRRLSSGEKKRLVAQYGDLSNDEDDDEYPFHNVIFHIHAVCLNVCLGHGNRSKNQSGLPQKCKIIYLKFLIHSIFP